MVVPMDTTDENWEYYSVERYAGSWKIGKLSNDGSVRQPLSPQEQQVEHKAALEAFDIRIFTGELVR